DQPLARLQIAVGRNVVPLYEIGNPHPKAVGDRVEGVAAAHDVGETTDALTPFGRSSHENGLAGPHDQLAADAQHVAGCNRIPACALAPPGPVLPRNRPERLAPLHDVGVTLPGAHLALLALGARFRRLRIR